jgi:tetratricopeptide (TPR) repeat protein
MVGKSFTELTGAFNRSGRFEEATQAAQRGLDYFSQTDATADRARLLASLAQAHSNAARYEPAHEALREALNIASLLSDPKLQARLLGTRSMVNFHLFRFREAAADALLSEQAVGPDALPQRALRTLHQIALYLGRLEEVARIADELEPLARKNGQSHTVAMSMSMRAWAEFAKTPDLAKLETGLQWIPKSDQNASYAFWDLLSEVQVGLVDFFRGNWASALLHARASCRTEVGSSLEGLGAGTLFRQMAYAGDHGAFAILDEKHAWLPLGGQQNTMGSWLMLACVIEGLAMLGERSQAAQLYPLTRQLVDTGAIMLWKISRFAQTIAGVAAAAAGQWQAAEEHFQIATQQSESLPYRLEQTELRRFHAKMLIDRSAAGDHQKAQTLLNEALQSYERIGMPRHVELTQTLLARCQ